MNALASIAGSEGMLGCPVEQKYCCIKLRLKNVKRRMELRGVVNNTFML